MKSKRSRLDRFISRHTGLNRRAVKGLLAQKRIILDGELATDVATLVDEFTRVALDGRVLQARQPIYLMLNKPAGILSATQDNKHKTVLDIIDREDRQQLHIVGRLDINSTGLILLTNDGRWSRQLTQPTAGIAKQYRFTLAQTIDESYVRAFAEGFYFAYENITTRPARLDIIDTLTADVFLTEGRYHQLKRMFGRFQNEVLTLHRTAIGGLTLDVTLAAGEYRELTAEEIMLLANPN
jgi:16S rRNA pseudouridine516 synthase